MKTIIRESLAMIVLVAAILLITVLVFFDYIKEDANQPQPAIYEVGKEEQNILKEKEEYEKSKETLVLKSMYSVDSTDLSSMKASGEFKQGQSSPFDETPITEITRDSEGNIYYQINNKTKNTTNNTANTNNTTNKKDSNNKTTNNTPVNNTTQTPNQNAGDKTQAQQIKEDITTSSPSSGSMMVTQKSGNGK
jgi:cytoskeletal protein RodZ